MIRQNKNDWISAIGQVTDASRMEKCDGKVKKNEEKWSIEDVVSFIMYLC